MCGLFGHFLKVAVGNTTELRCRLLAAQHALHHRGPDDRGLETFSISRGLHVPQGSLTFGHTRLSIIDLSPGGHQPMHSGDGRYTIVFNGEIYNYRELRAELKSGGFAFVTDSDTEVLLAAWAHWGASGLRRLTGMFAFAVYDRQDESLTLVRDAFGIKPLFYSLDEASLSFASEVPALLKLLPSAPDLDLQQAYDYLVYGRYDDQARTFHNGVAHLLPGHCLRVELRTLHASDPERWWWPTIRERTDLSFGDAASQLREMFLDSVRLHLRSDVPVGAALSGGVDSSAVVCAMRYLEPDMPIHTFSYVARGLAVDEEKWVDLVNAHVGAVGHKVAIEPDDLAGELEEIIHAQGEPFGSSSIYAQYRVFKAAREAEIVVTLDGQGADELLAGYPSYSQAYIRSLLEKRRFLELMTFLTKWAQWPGRGYKRAGLMLGAALTPKQLRTFARGLVGQSAKPSWLDIDQLINRGVVCVYPPSNSPSADGRCRRLIEELRASLSGSGLPSLLRHGDRNAMRWSIESRVPFLTTDLAEFLLSLPESYLLSPQGETKHVFRAAMRGLVPDAILDRRDKVGFQTPEGEWLNRHLFGASRKNWLGTLDKFDFINGEACVSEVQELVGGKKANDFLAWRLINFGAAIRVS